MISFSYLRAGRTTAAAIPFGFVVMDGVEYLVLCHAESYYTKRNTTLSPTAVCCIERGAAVAMRTRVRPKLAALVLLLLLLLLLSASNGMVWIMRATIPMLRHP